MKIGVHGKEFNRQSVPFIERIFSLLGDHELVISSRFVSHLKHASFKKYRWQTYQPGDDLGGLQIMLSIGGDGTLLETVSHTGRYNVPILGINTGRLGFLATIGRDETEQALNEVLQGSYRLDNRALIKLESSNPIFGHLNFALNDFTIVKKDTSSMITIHTFIDGDFLNSYWADGIIVATPTGSTGYSLSCGGPLIFPRSRNFVITPVSPHNLTVRPIVVADASEISFRIEGRSRKFLVSLDSRIATVDNTVELKVTKADFSVPLIQLKEQHYFKTLRQKLNWGLDARN